MDMPVKRRHRPKFGALLRQWRSVRRVSQLALAAEAQISSRHMSFLETGRAQPSREMVRRLAHVLDVPLADQNSMLVAAGYAPIYSESPLSAPEMEHVKRALDFILKQQEPYPAIVFDGEWNITGRNDAAKRVFSLFPIVSATGRKVGWNAIRTVFHPEALRQYIVNWEEYAGSLMQTLHREVADGINVNAARLCDELLTYPDVPSRWKVPDPSSVVPPLLAMRLKRDQLSLAFFKTLSMLAVPRDITLQQLRIECFYPADAITEETARRLAQGARGPD
jgi:transcriptional regulator with XRE-family HTH domain